MENINEFIIQNLQNVMYEKRLSTNEVALSMGISPSTMQRIINREIFDIKFGHIYNFSKKYSIPLSKLLPLDEEQEQPTVFNTLLKGLYQFKQDDDSMEPTIRRGDYVMVNKECNNFKPYLYLIEDYNGLRVRRLYKDKHGNLNVKADNENYETVTYTIEEQKEYISIKGIVMYKITEFL